MRLVILDDYDLSSEWAAKYIRNKIIQFQPSADRCFTLGLPTGRHCPHPHWCSPGFSRGKYLCNIITTKWSLLTCLMSFREHSLRLLPEVNWILQKWRYFLQICENLQHGWICRWVKGWLIHLKCPLHLHSGSLSLWAALKYLGEHAVALDLSRADDSRPLSDLVLSCAAHPANTSERLQSISNIWRTSTLTTSRSCGQDWMEHFGAVALKHNIYGVKKMFCQFSLCLWYER